MFLPDQNLSGCLLCANIHQMRMESRDRSRNSMFKACWEAGKCPHWPLCSKESMLKPVCRGNQEILSCWASVNWGCARITNIGSGSAEDCVAPGLKLSGVLFSVHKPMSLFESAYSVIYKPSLFMFLTTCPGHMLLPLTFCPLSLLLWRIYLTLKVSINLPALWLFAQTLIKLSLSFLPSYLIKESKDLKWDLGFPSERVCVRWGKTDGYSPHIRLWFLQWSAHVRSEKRGLSGPLSC